MSEAAEQFRSRASECRKLARAARDDRARQTLSQMADELDAEAVLIDSEEERKAGD
jgi:hypothetical protein